MKDAIDAGILELLASKICHDLISPIGAVNNGVEFMEDMGPGAGPEALELIKFSANQASAKLQAFRMAYGAGGADPNLKPEDVSKVIQQIVGAEDKITQAWNPHANLGETGAKKGFCKILACALLLAMEALPKGGKLLVSPGGGGVVVRAEGTNAGFRGQMEESLNLTIPREQLEPKYVHAYMTGLMARAHGFAVTVASAGEGSIDLKIAGI